MAPSTPGKRFHDPSPYNKSPLQLSFASPCRGYPGPTPPPVMGCRIGFSPVRECMPLGNAPLNVNLAAGGFGRSTFGLSPARSPPPSGRLEFISPPPPIRGLSRVPSFEGRLDSEERRNSVGSGWDSDSCGVPTLSMPLPEIVCQVWREFVPSGRRLAPGEAWELGVGLNQGTRNYMEDTCSYDIRLPSGGVVLGVFDGHRGSTAADYASIHMPRLFADRMAVTGDLGKALTEALLMADLELFAGRSRSQSRHSPDTGTTATVCAVLPCGRLAVGWLGDSRAVLCEHDRAVPLTRDHRLSDSWPQERRRVESAGASTAFDRVEDELAVTRALGDFNYKRGMAIGDDASNAVSNHAEVTITCVTDATPFLIIASDGLWDVMSEELVVEWCLGYFQREPYRPVDPMEDRLVTPRGGHPGAAAYLRGMMQDLCTEAVKTYRTSDNVTAAILLFKPLHKLARIAPPQQAPQSHPRSPAPEVRLPQSLRARRRPSYQ